MMPSTQLKIFFALSILAVIISAGWYPFRQRQKTDHFDFPFGETIATGVFLGAGLLHLLPESASMFTQIGYQYPFAQLITGLVFLLFLWLEHLGKELYHHHHDHHQHPGFAILAWMMLSIHSFVLGTALGLAQELSIAIMLFLAIITHKWAESFAIAVQLSKSSLPFKTNLILFSLFAFMTPLGIYTGWAFQYNLQSNSLIDPIMIAISAGTFLYLGTLHGLERCVMVERCCNLRYFSFVIIGFLLMASVAIFAQ